SGNGEGKRSGNSVPYAAKPFAGAAHGRTGADGQAIAALISTSLDTSQWSLVSVRSLLRGLLRHHICLLHPRVTNPIHHLNEPSYRGRFIAIDCDLDIGGLCYLSHQCRFQLLQGYWRIVLAKSI